MAERFGLPDLLDEENLCGATLLQLVSTGSALIAELLRLASKVPVAFVNPAEFGRVAFDLGYLEDPEDEEAKLNNEGLLDLDEEFLEAHAGFAARATALFAAVVKSWRDLDAFLDRLEAGYFIHHTVDGVIHDVRGKQLLGEAFYLYGAFLLLMEAKLPGPVRERLVVAHYRRRPDAPDFDVAAVCKLVKRTSGASSAVGVAPGAAAAPTPQRRPPKNSAEGLFARFGTERTAATVRKVVECLVSEDVYIQSPAWPHPDHRSIRLASQASVLYVLLYFDPTTLRARPAAMREAVDRHFSDNWIVHVYMGHVVDLTVAWGGTLKKKNEAPPTTNNSNNNSKKKTTTPPPPPPEQYPAARAALANVLSPTAVRTWARRNGAQVRACLVDLDAYLADDGHLTEQFILDHVQAVLDCLRRCNAALRWRLLHARALQDMKRRAEQAAAARASSSSGFFFFSSSSERRDDYDDDNHRASLSAATADDEPTEEAVVSLLLKTSQLEFEVKRRLASILETKAAKFDFCRAQVVDRIAELADFFSGGGGGLVVGGENNEARRDGAAAQFHDENLRRWFAALGAEVRALTMPMAENMNGSSAHATVLGRKLRTLVGALREVEHFDRVAAHVRILAFLADTREFLEQMVRIAIVHVGVVAQVEAVSDLAYAWELLGASVPSFHARLRAEPRTAVLLRATFVKLASILDVPLTRVSMVLPPSPDAASIAAYYSGELVLFARRVLDVIPISVFRILDRIVRIQTDRLAPVPAKFEPAQLKDLARLPARYDLAKLTHQIATFTTGILAMERTLLGVIAVEPRRVLHDGLRKELVKQVSDTMHTTLVFPQSTTTTTTTGGRGPPIPAVRPEDFDAVLQSLHAKLDGYRRSLEYVQDYIDLPGLEVWQEDLARLVNYNVEQECNRYLRRKVRDEDSTFQSEVVPIPRYAPLRTKHDDSYTFMGRTLSALLRLTSAAATTYAPEAAAWYIYGDGAKKAVCGARTFQAVERAIGVHGLAGLDRLVAFRIVHDLARLTRDYAALVAPHRPALDRLGDALHPSTHPPPQAAKLYQAAVKEVERAMPSLLTRIRSVGHAQLLRLSISHALRFRSRLDADALHKAVSNLDAAILSDVMEHHRTPETAPYPVPEGSKLLQDLTKLVDASGAPDPLAKVYVATDPLDALPTLLFLFVLSYMPKLEFAPRFATLAKRKATFPIDGYVLVAGVLTLCNQFHPAYLKELLAHLGQYVCATVHAHESAAAAAAAATTRSSFSKTAASDGVLPADLLNTVWFVDSLSRLAKLPPLAHLIPAHILALSPTHASSAVPAS